MRMSELERELTEMSFAEDRKACSLAKDGRIHEAEECRIRKNAFAEVERLAEKYNSNF